MTNSNVSISETVRAAISNRVAIVALESTVISHGLPYPLNLETATACEAAVEKAGAVPATIGIAGGRLTAGLSSEELAGFAASRAPDGSEIQKVSLSGLGAAITRRAWGATTVAATMRIARLAGIRVFATGGIGGVHRGAAESFDISSDLTALGSIPLVCVCAGAKAILDLGKTVEVLETLGVPIVGFRTREFPAFYSATSGLPVDVSVDSAAEAAEIAEAHWRSGNQSAVLVCVPVPAEHAMTREAAELAVGEAVQLADQRGIRGKALTPFLLVAMKESTGGRTLEANRALLINNASVAAEISVAMAEREGRSPG